jgi:hypothetical protein
MFYLKKILNKTEETLSKSENKEELIDQVQYLETKAKFDKLIIEDSDGIIVYEATIGIFIQSEIPDYARITCEEFYNDYI